MKTATIIDRYLFRNIILTTVMVAVVVMSIDAFLGLLREGKYVSRYDTYSYLDAIIYIGLRIPDKLVQFLPAFTLIGCLLGLGALASNSELTAMRAAGMAKSAIVISCMKTGLILVATMFLMSEFITPVSEIKADQHRDQARGKKIVTEVNNLWLKNGDDIVNVGTAKSDTTLTDVQVFDIQNNQLTSWKQAASAKQDAGAWRLEDIKARQYLPEKVTILNEAQQYQDTLVNPELFEAAATEPRFMSLRTLWAYIGYLKENNLDSEVYIKSFWKRLTAPFSILVMMLLAMPFVFVNKRAGNAGARIVIGIMIGFGYEILSNLVTNAGQVYGYSAIGAVAPLVVASAIGLIVLKRSEA